MLERQQRHWPSADGKIEPQFLEPEPLRMQPQNRARECRDEMAGRERIGAKMNRENPSIAYAEIVVLDDLNRKFTPDELQ